MKKESSNKANNPEDSSVQEQNSEDVNDQIRLLYTPSKFLKRSIPSRATSEED